MEELSSGYWPPLKAARESLFAHYLLLYVQAYVSAINFSLFLIFFKLRLYNPAFFFQKLDLIIDRKLNKMKLQSSRITVISCQLTTNPVELSTFKSSICPA